MHRVLLVVDLEGVAGVDRVSDLVGTSPTYPEACALLAKEIDAAAGGLRAAGFDHILVSDSHRAGVGAPNVRAGDIDSGIEIIYSDDPYAPELLERADAIACLGMHAAAGTEGFAAHTTSIQSCWRIGQRVISETDIVLGLAADRGIPVVFVSGDDVLGRHTSRDVPYLPLKVSLDRRRARSCTPAEARDRLAKIAASTPVVPAPLPGTLALTFKSKWQADTVAAAGARRVDDRTVMIDELTFPAAYRRAIELQELTEPPLRAALRTFHPGALAEDCVGLLGRSFSVVTPISQTAAVAARRAVPTLLDDSYAASSWRLADRALALHMLEHHAPALFSELASTESFAALSTVPIVFTTELSPTEAMARMDALYLRHVRAIDRPDIDHAAIAECIRHIAQTNLLFGWLLDELAVAIGVPRTLALSERPLRPRARVLDLYWLTHLFLLETQYLARPLPSSGWEARIEELFLAVDYVLVHQHVDLAAEIAICLQLAGEHDAAEHHALLAFLERHQRKNGEIVDLSIPAERRVHPEDAARLDAHTTAASIIALAGARR